MAGSRASRSAHRNFFLIEKDEFAKEAPTKGSNTHIFTLALLFVLTPAPALAPLSTNELFIRFIKAYLKAQTQLT